MKKILHSDSRAIIDIAHQMARDNGEDPEGYLDYSDLRSGKQRWEYFEKAAAEKHHENILNLLVDQVVSTNPTTTADAVRTTVAILEGTAK